MYAFSSSRPTSPSSNQKAKSWDLAELLQTCLFLVELRLDLIHLIFFCKAEGKGTAQQQQELPTLFAQSKIDLKSNKKYTMEYCVEGFVDLSWYFAVWIVDKRSGLDARITFGFQDQHQATDFQESLQHYTISICCREQVMEAYQQQQQHQEDGSTAGATVECRNRGSPGSSKLSLQEGERIHVDEKGGKSPESKISKLHTHDSLRVVLLLKKPPQAVTAASSSSTSNTELEEHKISITFSEINLNDSIKAKKSKGGDSNNNHSFGRVVGRRSMDVWGIFTKLMTTTRNGMILRIMSLDLLK